MTAKPSKLMEVLMAHGLADRPGLLGEILAAQLIDAMERPETARKLAEYASSEGAQNLVKANKKRRKAPTVDV
jgi:hypothetical protein